MNNIFSLYWNYYTIAGNIIIKQKGNKYWPGEGIQQGSYFTLFAVKYGTVKFSEKKRTKFDGRVYKDRFVSIV